MVLQNSDYYSCFYPVFPLPSHLQLEISTPLTFPFSPYQLVLSHIHFHLSRFHGPFTSITTNNSQFPCHFHVLGTGPTQTSPFSRPIIRLQTITERNLKKLHASMSPPTSATQNLLVSQLLPRLSTNLFLHVFPSISQRKQNKEGTTSFLPTYLSFPPLHNYN